MKIIHSLVVLGILLGASGCAQQRRAVTHIRIQKDKAYLAYAEWDEGFFTGLTGAKDRSRVKQCSIEADNSLKCAESASINSLLNPDEAGSAPAPAAEAPATPPAASEAPAEDGAAPEAAAP